MTVSILIPAFFAEAFIARAVASILTQTMQDFEVIIAADDGQDYLAILKAKAIADPRLRCIGTGGAGMGAAHARNYALRVARGEWIALLDADDAFLPHHLERLLPAAMKHGLAIAQVDYVDHATGQRLPNRAKPFNGGLLPLEEIALACLHTYVPIVFDRKRIDRRWNASVKMLEDVVFLAECCDLLGQVWYDPNPSYRYFRREGSLCNSSIAAEQFLEAGKVILALFDKGEITMKSHTASLLKNYIKKNNALEIAFKQALKSNKMLDYQDFIGCNLAILHAPIV